MHELPDVSGMPAPFLPLELIQRTAGMRTSFDAGRGCPFLCSFCTIINVQGRKSRNRTPDDVERIVRTNAAQGVNNFFISDDNFARNKEWEPIFDRLIKLREQDRFIIYIIIQVDTMCHKIPGFIEKAGRAGVNRVFIGLENINPEALKEARKGQNRITEYRAMLQAWHSIGALTYAGYILGFPNDTPASIEADINIIQRELPIDLLEFFILTPLPGSQDHKELYVSGVELDPDMNHYDLEHVTAPHPTMSKDELQTIYRKAWDIYYSPEHVARVIRRAKAFGYPTKGMMVKLLSFYGCIRFEKMHPLEGGLVRRKYRRDRRPGMPFENPLVFYPRYAWEMIDKYTRFFWMARQYWRILKRIDREPLINPEQDIALRPVDNAELEQLAIYSHSNAAQATVARARRKQHTVKNKEANASAHARI